jgi:RND superfamily putative drug exporter
LIIDETDGETAVTDSQSIHEMRGRTRHARRWVWGAIGLIVAWFALGSVIGPAAGQLSSAQENDNATFLPADAEATRVIEEQQRFAQESTLPVVVLFVSDQQITDTQQAAVAGFVDEVPSVQVETDDDVTVPLADFLGSAPVTAVPSEDGQAILVTVLLSESKTTDALPNGESPVLAVATALSDAASEAADPVGLESYVTGPGGLLADLISVFGAIDGTLLLATALVVTLILILVYRSPFLWVIPLVSAGFALSLASAVVYLLATNDVLQLNGQSQGILTVLVFGAGTDYALLMVSRYREELHYYERPVDALRAAWRGTVEPILASGGTASLGLLMLLFSELNSNKSTGPVAAVGIASALLVMLTFLPALLLVPSAALPLGAFLGVIIPGIVLELIFDTPLAPFAIVGALLAVLSLLAVLVGGLLRQFVAPEKRPRVLSVEPVRWAFWPRVPHQDKQDDKLAGTWAKVSRQVGRRPRVVWIGAAAGLAVLAFFSTTLSASGIATTDLFVNEVDSVTGQEKLAEHFPAGEGSPATVIGPADSLDAMTAALSDLDGVASVVPYTGAPTGPPPDDTEQGQPGTDTPTQGPEPLVVDGLVQIDVTLTDAADSDAAEATVVEMRSVLDDVAGEEALVGGTTAVNYDTQQASIRDNKVVIPLVLLVIFVILMILLRAVLAPVLLIGTVVLSYFATLGLSSIAFDLRGFPGEDASFPLFTFVFLVALGIDYNIFLMTRVREESLKLGTRPGLLKGLAVTGGVITSAGVVLAATFLVLGVLPLVVLQQIGFAVAAGVLIDTLIVRSLLVPALSYEIGGRIWWPSKLMRQPDATPEQQQASGVPYVPELEPTGPGGSGVSTT